MEMKTYKQAMEDVLQFVADQSKDHPDEAVRLQASKVLADLLVATLLDLGKQRREDRTDVSDLPTGREGGE
jgi:hypothetical protein